MLIHNYIDYNNNIRLHRQRAVVRKGRWGLTLAAQHKQQVGHVVTWYSGCGGMRQQWWVPGMAWHSCSDMANVHSCSWTTLSWQVWVHTDVAHLLCAQTWQHCGDL